MQAAEFLGKLFKTLPDNHRVELRKVPGQSQFLRLEELVDPPDLSSSTYYFSVAPRRGTDLATDVSNLIWCDSDGNPIEINAVTPPPSAIVESGRKNGLHLYWRLSEYISIEKAVCLAKLAALAYGGDFAVCDKTRVMRVPGSLNKKHGGGVPCVLQAMDVDLQYDPDELEERLLAQCIVPHFIQGSPRHQVALSLGAILGRAEWPVERAVRAMEYLYALAPGSDRRGKVDAIKTTYAKREAGERVSAKVLKDAMKDEAYQHLLDGLGISSRDGDILVDGETVGSRKNLERDIANFILKGGDWASASGQLARWQGTHWRLADESSLTSEIFQVLGKTYAIKDGQEEELEAKAATASAVAKVMMGSLMAQPLGTPPEASLALSNGSLNLKTRELTTHTRELNHLWVIDVQYDAQAKAPEWERFIHEAVPTPDLRRLLQEWFGYCLLDGNPWQRMLWLYGPSGTGKSTFLKAIEMLLGPAATSISSEKMSDYTVAKLDGMRAAICSELSPRTLRTSVLKALIAGDPVQARHPFGRPFSVKFGGKIVWSSNSLPPLDEGEGMWRRIVPVAFAHRPAAVDNFLDKKILAEAPGVLNWALEGLDRVLALEFSGETWFMPVSVSSAIEEYKEASDTAARFFAEEMEMDPEAITPAMEIYQRYTSWCKENSILPEKFGPIFYQDMRKAGLEPFGLKEVGKRKVKVWKGGSLVPGIFGG